MYASQYAHESTNVCVRVEADGYNHMVKKIEGKYIKDQRKAA
jgi:hypothetical protein